MQLVAFTIKGLETIVAEEISDKGFIVEQVLVKKVIFSAKEEDLAYIPDLQTVEDAAIVIDRVKVAARSLTTEDIAGYLSQYNLQKQKAFLKDLRNLDESFSVTVNVVKGKLKAEDIKHEVASLIAADYGWLYTPQQHTNFDLRLVLEQDELLLGVRLHAEPLYKRNYQPKSRLGALKPTIAASMLHLLGPQHGSKVVDLSCGSGTLLAEAAKYGYEVYGSDKRSWSYCC